MDFIKEWSDSFAKQYGAEFLICHISKVTGEDLAGADVLMLVRCTTPYAAFVCAEYKKSGGTLIAFYDDDLLNPPPAINYRLRNARKKAVLGILRHADILMSGNKYLMDKYSKIYGTGRVVLADAIGEVRQI
jgi:hypothetical protein